MSATTPVVATPTILSYFTVQNSTNELYASWPEVALVFATSVAISLYQKDEPIVACERGAILGVGQYIGGFIGDALNNASTYGTSTYAQYGPVMTKFVIATGLFIAGNRELINSQQEASTLFGESVVASVIAHYGANYYNRYQSSATASTPPPTQSSTGYSY